MQSQTRLVNQLTACLKAYYPVALTLFSKLQQRSTLVFLQTYPTPQVAHAASAEAITAALKQAGHPRFAHWGQQVWEKLRPPSLQADPVTTRTKARLMLALVGQLLLLIEQIATYDEEIERLFERHPDAATFRGLPGTGKRLAPRLLVGWGDDRERYVSAASLQALGGTSPVPFESGKYAKAHKRRACIKPLRNVLYHFARAMYLSGTLGRCLLPAQAQRGENAEHGGAGARQCVGSDHLRPLAQARALPDGYLPRGPTDS